MLKAFSFLLMQQLHTLVMKQKFQKYWHQVAAEVLIPKE